MKTLPMQDMQRSKSLKSLQIPTESLSVSANSLDLPAPLSSAVSTPLPGVKTETAKKAVKASQSVKDVKKAVKASQSVKDDELANKTVAELQQICRDETIKGFSGKKKIELIELIMSSAQLPELLSRNQTMSAKTANGGLEEKTVAQLQQICRDQGITGFSGKNIGDDIDADHVSDRQKRRTTRQSRSDHGNAAAVQKAYTRGLQAGARAAEEQVSRLSEEVNRLIAEKSVSSPGVVPTAEEAAELTRTFEESFDEAEDAEAVCAKLDRLMIAQRNARHS